jgi:hypothetical protein
MLAFLTFPSAIGSLFSFDRYIEASKARLYHSGGDSVAPVAQAVLLYVFENILKLLHPFMPFVTEELWQVMISLISQHLRMYFSGSLIYLLLDVKMGLVPGPDLNTNILVFSCQHENSKATFRVWDHIFWFIIVGIMNFAYVLLSFSVKF